MNHITSSSAVIVILSYLPLKSALSLQLLGMKFYNVYIPRAIYKIPCYLQSVFYFTENQFKVVK
jgi:hypothetical protein